MSFILDALRKSEHERQRATAPGIAHVPLGIVRREVPRWAVALIAALGVAVVALGGAFVRSFWLDSRPAAEPAAEQRIVTAPLAVPPLGEGRAGLGAQRGAENPSEPERSGRREDGPRDFGTASAASDRDTGPSPPDRAVRAAATSGFDAPQTAAFRPAERAPPAEPAAEPRDADAAPAARANETRAAPLPSAAALAAEGITLPELRLELHAYAERPEQRFVFINGTKYVEGATLAEGPKVVSIEPNGAVLTYLGRRFLLTPQ